MESNTGFQKAPVVVAGLLTAFIISLFFALATFDFSKSEKFVIGVILVLSLVGMLAIFSFQFASLFVRHPATVTIAVLGLPAAGKSTYVNVLLHELQQNTPTGWQFHPYSLETIEHVTMTIKELVQGNWPQRTISETMHTYRANLTVKGSFAKPVFRYKLEVADYAGENTEVMAANGPWLHHQDFFRYAVNADIVFILIDVTRLTDISVNAAQDAATIVMEYVSVLQTLAAHRGAQNFQLINSPVAVLFTKYDLIDGFEPTKEQPRITIHKAGNSLDSSISDLHEQLLKKELSKHVEGLINTGKKLCKNFAAFRVSSVGHMEHGVPTSISPFGVVEPLIWAVDLLPNTLREDSATSLQIPPTTLTVSETTVTRALATKKQS